MPTDELSTIDRATLSDSTYSAADILDISDDPMTRRTDLLILLRALAARLRAIPPAP